MKVALIEKAGRFAQAVITGERVAVIGGWHEDDGAGAPFTLPSLSHAEIEAGVRSSTESLALADVRLAPPIGASSKIICIGLNYRNHVEETLNDLAENPGLFTKLPDALVGEGQLIVRPKVSEHFDYEGEITVVIGKAGRHIAAEDALDHVFGYTIMLDGSVRDYQKHSISAGKNFWRSGSLGPWIVTADELPDPKLFTLETRLNGVQVQQTTGNLMIYDIPTLIAYVSRWTPLAPGDVIATGTPGGVGARRSPPLWMRDGDRIEVEVSGVGVLTNKVVDEVC